MDIDKEDYCFMQPIPIEIFKFFFHMKRFCYLNLVSEFEFDSELDSVSKS